MAGVAMLSRWRLQEQIDESGRGGEGGAGDSKRRCHYRGRRLWVGSFPAAGATATDAAMPLSPPTDDGNDHDDEGEGRRDDKGRERSVDDARRESGER